MPPHFLATRSTSHRAVSRSELLGAKSKHQVVRAEELCSSTEDEFMTWLLFLYCIVNRSYFLKSRTLTVGGMGFIPEFHLMMMPGSGIHDFIIIIIIINRRSGINPIPPTVIDRD